MNGYNDLYGSDQVVVNPTQPFPQMGYRATQSSVNHMGMYEDQLRFQQYGIPAKLRCSDMNPYIQDDITKSQRHAPIRIGSIQDRMPEVANTSCNPGLAAMYNGKPCGINGNQGIRYSTTGDCNVDSPNCKHKESSDTQPKKSSGLDANALMYIFIFIVLIFMCMHFWKSVSDLKKATEGGFQNLRDLIAIKG